METKTKIAITLRRASEYLGTFLSPDARWALRDYHDHKSAQLLDAMADLLIAEAQIESWQADLGIIGCQEDDTCVNGVCVL
jgi:hypothetical protein